MYQMMYIDIGIIKKVKTTRPDYTVRFTTVDRLVIMLSRSDSVKIRFL